MSVSRVFCNCVWIIWTATTADAAIAAMSSNIHFGYATYSNAGDQFDGAGGSAAMVDASTSVHTGQSIGLRTLGGGAHAFGTSRYRVSYGPLYSAQLAAFDVQVALGQFRETTTADDHAVQKRGIFGMIGFSRAFEIGRGVFASWTIINSWQADSSTSPSALPNSLLFRNDTVKVLSTSRGAFLGIRVLTSSPRVTP